MKYRRRRTRYRVIQTHHASYNPEVTVLLFQSEHRIVTSLNRLAKSKPSLVFLRLLAKVLDSSDKPEGTLCYSESEMAALQVENQRKRLAATTKRRRTKK